MMVVPRRNSADREITVDCKVFKYKPMNGGLLLIDTQSISCVVYGMAW